MNPKNLLLLIGVSTALLGLDLEEEMVKTYKLSVEQSQMSKERLFEYGLQIFNTDAEYKTLQTKSGDTLKYMSSDNKKEGMRFIIPSALLGDIRACRFALNYLKKDGIYPRSRALRYEISQILHDSGDLFGTFMLAQSYKHGVGVGRNFDLATLYFKKVSDTCNYYRSTAVQYLNNDDNLGSYRCETGIAAYKRLSSLDKVRLPNIDPDVLKKNQELRIRMQGMLDMKKGEALEKYTK